MEQNQNPAQPGSTVAHQRESLFGGKATEGRLFTNLSDTLLVLTDLGSRGPNGSVVAPETIKPHETRDLGSLYSDEDLRSSKSLRHFLFSEPPVVIEGKKPDSMSWLPTPGAALKARAAISNEFTDNTRNDYDERLKGVLKKEKAEDDATKQGHTD